MSCSQIILDKLNGLQKDIITLAGVTPSELDYCQEIARSGFGDMLHDSERNRLYFDGLRCAINSIRRSGKGVHVLDIGTGSGLLAMMAAKLGADTVTACELFLPMAECAARVVATNGFGEKIKIIRKRSTEIAVGSDADMLPRRANLLVAELLDTELIGEGAIDIYNHAHKHLLTDDCLVVPCLANVFVLPIHCDQANAWSRLLPIRFDSGQTFLKIPKNCNPEESSCSSRVLHDLQLSQLDTKLFNFLSSSPIKVFEFDFGCHDGIPIEKSSGSTVSFSGFSNGSCDALAFWWEIYFDREKKIHLSCAPKWARHDKNEPAWRDHWMQALYYPITPRVFIEKNQTFYVSTNHDEFSWWFDISKNNKIPPRLSMPIPTPGLESFISRQRLGQINEGARNKLLIGALANHLRYFVRPFVCLFIGDCPILSLFAPLLCPKVRMCYIFESNIRVRHILENILLENGLEKRVCFLSGVHNIVDLRSATQLPERIDFVFGEPWFESSLLPWHNLLFWFSYQQIFSTESIDGNVRVMPSGCCLWILPVEFRDLWKIRAPLGSVEGFDLTHFDVIIERAIKTCDDRVEAHSLWEYPCRATGFPTKIQTFDFDALPVNTSVEGSVDISAKHGFTNGVVIWTEWEMDKTTVIKDGPTDDVELGQFVHWNRHCKQGVYFMPTSNEDASCLEYSAQFLASEGDIKFIFKIND